MVSQGFAYSGRHADSEPTATHYQLNTKLLEAHEQQSIPARTDGPTKPHPVQFCLSGREVRRLAESRAVFIHTRKRSSVQATVVRRVRQLLHSEGFWSAHSHRQYLHTSSSDLCYCTITPLSLNPGELHQRSRIPP